VWTFLWCSLLQCLTTSKKKKMTSVRGQGMVWNAQEYRITEWFGLEGTFKGHLGPTPSPWQGHLPLDQVAQSLIQPGLEHFQGGGIHNFSGLPVPVSHHPHSEEFLSNFQSKPILFQFKTIAPCSVTTDLGKKSFSIFVVSPL